MTVPNRDNESAPDIEQERRAQARQASAFARGEVSELPAFATKGPDATVRDGEYDPETGVVRNESFAASEPAVEVTPEEPSVVEIEDKVEPEADPKGES